MRHHKWLIAGLIVWVLVPLATACGNDTTKDPASNAANHVSTVDNNNPKQISISNVVLARSDVPNRPGQQLELVDVKGQYVNDTSIGPFEGNNWTGHFQLRVVNHLGKILSVFNLPDNKFVQYLFMRKFQFHFADYNGDGYPDFALGQHFGSNGNTYEIYTVKPDGLFQLPTVPAEIFVADFSYSPLFKQVKPHGFQIKFYDNAKVQWYQVTYTWKGGEFVPSSTKGSHTP